MSGNNKSPSPLLTVKTRPLPEDMSMDLLQETSITKYTKHYYIGTERIASTLGTMKNLGLLCENVWPGSQDIIDEMGTKTMDAGGVLVADFAAFEKELQLPEPYLYETYICTKLEHDAKNYDTYWYHPDHLGSSSYITNLGGTINQHMEYLPFGETLVEEHLNSYNSPYKFNAKELDAETGNYYYSSRYYNPKWSIFLSVDEHFSNYPSFSPYAYTFHNPINFIDPDGRDGIRVIDKKNKTITIKAVYYVQTEARPTRGGGNIKGYTPKQIARMQKRTNKWLNKQNLSVTEGEYEGYTIQFDLSFKEGGNSLDTRMKADNEQYEGHYCFSPLNPRTRLYSQI